MTSIPLRGNDIASCDIRELGVWEAIDAYQAAFAAASAAELGGQGGAAYHVRQAALEAVIADQLRVCAVISIHRGLLAGASVGEVAHVLGRGPAEVAARWRSWADGQRRLSAQCPGLGVGRREYDRVAAALRAGSSVGSTDDPVGGCSCRGETRK